MSKVKTQPVNPPTGEYNQPNQRDGQPKPEPFPQQSWRRQLIKFLIRPNRINKKGQTNLDGEERCGFRWTTKRNNRLKVISSFFSNHGAKNIIASF
jgi:hypothetical protein